MSNNNQKDSNIKITAILCFLLLFITHMNCNNEKDIPKFGKTVNEAKMSDKRISYFKYWSNAAEEGEPITLEVIDEKFGIYSHLTNDDNPNEKQVGLFESELEPNDLSNLLETIGSDSFRQMENPTSVLPGEVVRKIEYHEGKNQIVKYITAPNKLFLEAEQQIETLVKKIKKSPTVSLSLYSESIPSEVKYGKKIKIGVDLLNSGECEVDIPGQGNWGKDIFIDVRAWRSDLGPEVILSDHHMCFFIPSNVTFYSQSKEGDKKEKGNIVLYPGEKLMIIAEDNISCGLGRYGIDIALIMTAKNKKNNFDKKILLRTKEKELHIIE